MPAALHVSSRSAASIAASTTVYGPVDGSPAGYNASETASAAQRTMRTAGTFSRMAVVVTANDRGASTITFRSNSADGAQSIAVTASTPGRYEDLTNSDTVAAGALVNNRIVTGAGGTTFVIRASSILFSATSGVAVSLWKATGGNTLNTASTTFYKPVNGTDEESATEANVSTRIKAPGTWRNMQVLIRTNTRGTDTLARSRINAGNGAQVVTCTANTTGWFEDLTNSDAVAVNDLLAQSLVLGTGTGDVRTWSHGSEFQSTTSPVGVCIASSVTGLTVAASATRYLAVGGAMTGNSATENDVETLACVPFVASMLGVNVITNTITGDSTIALRKNTTTTALVATITGLTAGWFFDLTNSVAIAATDEVAYLVTGGALGTSMVLETVTVNLAYGGLFRPAPLSGLGGAGPRQFNPTLA